MLRSLVGSEMCIRDRVSTQSTGGEPSFKMLPGRRLVEACTREISRPFTADGCPLSKYDIPERIVQRVITKVNERLSEDVAEHFTKNKIRSVLRAIQQYEHEQDVKAQGELRTDQFSNTPADELPKSWPSKTGDRRARERYTRAHVELMESEKALRDARRRREGLQAEIARLGPLVHDKTHLQSASWAADSELATELEKTQKLLKMIQNQLAEDPELKEELKRASSSTLQPGVEEDPQEALKQLATKKHKRPRCVL
eukprot:TRINITY_DN5590_c0_g1_i5.p1 TRINITY_DN5590_c0_g1~~TRINITY_DN5590_c0_g1_i5.p1  ORF type:complete len:284 (+),score=87.49 TRINITY_DN5590_c0_g1_i5:86-853(+)